jgi:hypothetical protein
MTSVDVGIPLELAPLSDITPWAEEINMHHAVGHFNPILAP